MERRVSCLVKKSERKQRTFADLYAVHSLDSGESDAVEELDLLLVRVCRKSARFSASLLLIQRVLSYSCEAVEAWWTKVGLRWDEEGEGGEV